MNARWRRRADLWVPSAGEAISFGRRTLLLARLAEEHPMDMALATNPLASSSRSTDL
jgi:hypothetical protein